MSEITKTQIRQKLRVVEIELGPVAKDVFATVTERRMRYVVALFLTGDTVSRTVDIVYAGERTDDIFIEVPVAPADLVSIPENSYNIEDPIIVVEGGCRITAAQNAGTGVNLTCVYWDDIER